MAELFRPDLNGVIFDTPDGGRALVISGVARYIENDGVAKALFGSSERHSIGSVSEIAYGKPLVSGTCLVRASGSNEIFLITGLPDTRRHSISSFETFNILGFHLGAVLDLPWFVVQAVPVGVSI